MPNLTNDSMNMKEQSKPSSDDEFRFTSKDWEEELKQQERKYIQEATDEDFYWEVHDYYFSPWNRFFLKEIIILFLVLTNLVQFYFH